MDLTLVTKIEESMRGFLNILSVLACLLLLGVSQHRQIPSALLP
jgi:hypothetical protein